MKNLLMAIVILGLSQCDKSDICEDQCKNIDDMIIGDWKLVMECKCYNNGGDFIWHPVFDNYSLIFKDDCSVHEVGNSGTNCGNEGKYNTNQDQITITFFCPTGSSTSKYEYLFINDTDTLILKGLIDEGYFGFKYIRNK
jgi:hypothetical protein